MNHKHNYTVKITKEKANNEIVIEGELSVEDFDVFVKQEIKNLKNETEFPGFRKGNAPEKMIIEKVGMSTILYGAAEEALSHLYPHIIEDHKVEAIGKPQVTITKLAQGNPMGFKLTLESLPEINFDYKKIASKENKKEVVTEKVTDEEIDKIIKEIKHSHKENKNEVIDDKKEEVDATITDDLVKTFGDFKTTEEFRSKIKENLTKEKEYRAKEKRRIGLLDALIKEAGIKVPKILVESEKEHMLARFKHDVSRMGIKWEDYIKHAKKTEDEIKKEMEKEAEEKASLELILDYVTKKEGVLPSRERVEEEIKHFTSHYKDISPEQAESYIRHSLSREATIEFLENTTKE